jgi:hypothetical protein
MVCLSSLGLPSPCLLSSKEHIPRNRVGSQLRNLVRLYSLADAKIACGSRPDVRDDETNVREVRDDTSNLHTQDDMVFDYVGVSIGWAVLIGGIVVIANGQLRRVAIAHYPATALIAEPACYSQLPPLKAPAKQ